MKQFSQTQIEFLAKPILANFSIINSKTKLPIVFPAWVLEYNNKLYLTSVLQSRKVRHLEKDNRIGLNVVDPKGFPYLVISGRSKFIYQSEEEKFSLLRNKIIDKYDKDGKFRDRMTNDPNPLERVVIEIEPQRIFGGVD